jgi:hypothetical protein
MVIIVYAITYVLYKENVITGSMHAKTWNILIFISGLILAVIGLLITLFTEYSINIPLISDIVFWHVEFGILLFIIALFHVYLHWERFKIITLRI